MNSKAIVAILLLVIVLGGAGWFMASRGLFPGSSKDDNTKPSEWMAVFLTNGQVYFGKMSNAGKQFVKLNDIYYLQLAQAPQPEGQNTTQTQQQQQVSLVKLGNELHGPVDEMQINRDHILFYEEMKNEAKVVEAINRYKKEGPVTNPAAAGSPAAATTPGVTASPAVRR